MPPKSTVPGLARHTGGNAPNIRGGSIHERKGGTQTTSSNPSEKYDLDSTNIITPIVADKEADQVIGTVIDQLSSKEKERITHLKEDQVIEKIEKELQACAEIYASNLRNQPDFLNINIDAGLKSHALLSAKCFHRLVVNQSVACFRRLGTAADQYVKTADPVLVNPTYSNSVQTVDEELLAKCIPEDIFTRIRAAANEEEKRNILREYHQHADATQYTQILEDYLARPARPADIVQPVFVAEASVSKASALFTGYGYARFITDLVYEGEWKDGAMHGKGIFAWPDGTVYQGEVQNNQITGKGRLIYTDGSYYIGEWVEGYRHGLGVWVFPVGGLRYTGSWFKGKRHGKGTMYFDKQESLIYHGDWLHGMRHGYGCMLYNNTCVYDGMWEEDKRHGRGIFLDQNGDCYHGDWDANTMHGYGEYIWGDNDTDTDAMTAEHKSSFYGTTTTTTNTTNTTDITLAQYLHQKSQHNTDVGNSTTSYVYMKPKLINVRDIFTSIVAQRPLPSLTMLQSYLELLKQASHATLSSKLLDAVDTFTVLDLAQANADPHVLNLDINIEQDLQHMRERKLVLENIHIPLLSGGDTNTDQTSSSQPPVPFIYGDLYDSTNLFEDDILLSLQKYVTDTTDVGDEYATKVVLASTDAHTTLHTDDVSVGISTSTSIGGGAHPTLGMDQTSNAFSPYILATNSTNTPLNTATLANIHSINVQSKPEHLLPTASTLARVAKQDVNEMYNYTMQYIDNVDKMYLCNRYVGSIMHGQRHGHGSQFYSSGAVYTGAWEYGKKNGRGVFIFDNGHRLETLFKDDDVVDRNVWSGVAIDQWNLPLTELIREQVEVLYPYEPSTSTSTSTSNTEETVSTGSRDVRSWRERLTAAKEERRAHTEYVEELTKAHNHRITRLYARHSHMLFNCLRYYQYITDNCIAYVQPSQVSLELPDTEISIDAIPEVDMYTNTTANNSGSTNSSNTLVHILNNIDLDMPGATLKTIRITTRAFHEFLKDAGLLSTTITPVYVNQLIYSRYTSWIQEGNPADHHEDHILLYKHLHNMEYEDIVLLPRIIMEVLVHICVHYSQFSNILIPEEDVEKYCQQDTKAVLLLATKQTNIHSLKLHSNLNQTTAINLDSITELPKSELSVHISLFPIWSQVKYFLDTILLERIGTKLHLNVFSKHANVLAKSLVLSETEAKSVLHSLQIYDEEDAPPEPVNYTDIEGYVTPRGNTEDYEMAEQVCNINRVAVQQATTSIDVSSPYDVPVVHYGVDTSNLLTSSDVHVQYNPNHSKYHKSPSASTIYKQVEAVLSYYTFYNATLKYNINTLRTLFTIYKDRGYLQKCGLYTTEPYQLAGACTHSKYKTQHTTLACPCVACCKAQAQQEHTHGVNTQAVWCDKAKHSIPSLCTSTTTTTTTTTQPSMTAMSKYGSKIVNKIRIEDLLTLLYRHKVIEDVQYTEHTDAVKWLSTILRSSALNPSEGLSTKSGVPGNTGLSASGLVSSMTTSAPTTVLGGTSSHSTGTSSSNMGASGQQGMSGSLDTTSTGASGVLGGDTSNTYGDVSLFVPHTHMVSRKPISMLTDTDANTGTTSTSTDTTTTTTTGGSSNNGLDTTTSVSLELPTTSTSKDRQRDRDTHGSASNKPHSTPSATITPSASSQSTHLLATDASSNAGPAPTIQELRRLFIHGETNELIRVRTGAKSKREDNDANTSVHVEAMMGLKKQLQYEQEVEDGVTQKKVREQLFSDHMLSHVHVLLLICHELGLFTKEAQQVTKLLCHAVYLAVSTSFYRECMVIAHLQKWRSALVSFERKSHESIVHEKKTMVSKKHTNVSEPVVQVPYMERFDEWLKNGQVGATGASGTTSDTGSTSNNTTSMGEDMPSSTELLSHLTILLQAHCVGLRAVRGVLELVLIACLHEHFDATAVLASISKGKRQFNEYDATLTHANISHFTTMSSASTSTTATTTTTTTTSIPMHEKASNVQYLLQQARHHSLPLERVSMMSQQLSIGSLTTQQFLEQVALEATVLNLTHGIDSCGSCMKANTHLDEHVTLDMYLSDLSVLGRQNIEYYEDLWRQQQQDDGTYYDGHSHDVDEDMDMNMHGMDAGVHHHHHNHTRSRKNPYSNIITNCIIREHLFSHTFQSSATVASAQTQEKKQQVDELVHKYVQMLPITSYGLSHTCPLLHYITKTQGQFTINSSILTDLEISYSQVYNILTSVYSLQCQLQQSKATNLQSMTSVLVYLPNANGNNTTGGGANNTSTIGSSTNSTDAEVDSVIAEHSTEFELEKTSIVHSFQDALPYLRSLERLHIMFIFEDDALVLDNTIIPHTLPSSDSVLDILPEKQSKQADMEGAAATTTTTTTTTTGTPVRTDKDARGGLDHTGVTTAEEEDDLDSLHTLSNSGTPSTNAYNAAMASISTLVPPVSYLPQSRHVNYSRSIPSTNHTSQSCHITHLLSSNNINRLPYMELRHTLPLSGKHPQDTVVTRVPLPLYDISIYQHAEDMKISQLCKDTASSNMILTPKGTLNCNPQMASLLSAQNNVDITSNSIYYPLHVSTQPSMSDLHNVHGHAAATPTSGGAASSSASTTQQGTDGNSHIPLVVSNVLAVRDIWYTHVQRLLLSTIRGCLCGSEEWHRNYSSLYMVNTCQNILYYPGIQSCNLKTLITYTEEDILTAPTLAHLLDIYHTTMYTCDHTQRNLPYCTNNLRCQTQYVTSKIEALLEKEISAQMFINMQYSNLLQKRLLKNALYYYCEAQNNVLHTCIKETSMSALTAEIMANGILRFLHLPFTNLTLYASKMVLPFINTIYINNANTGDFGANGITHIAGCPNASVQTNNQVGGGPNMNSMNSNNLNDPSSNLPMDCECYHIPASIAHHTSLQILYTLLTTIGPYEALDDSDKYQYQARPGASLLLGKLTTQLQTVVLSRQKSKKSKEQHKNRH